MLPASRAQRGVRLLQWTGREVSRPWFTRETLWPRAAGQGSRLGSNAALPLTACELRDELQNPYGSGLELARLCENVHSMGLL